MTQSASKIVLPSFVVQVRKKPQTLLARLGKNVQIVVPKKMVARAVDRNRIKRVVREFVRRELNVERLKDYFFRFQVRTVSGKKKNSELFKELKDFLKHI